MIKTILRTALALVVFTALCITDCPSCGNVVCECEKEVHAETVDATETVDVETMIIHACKDYMIPSDIALAIAKLETGHFSSRAYLEGNNVGGLSVNEEPLAFDSLEEGVDAFVSNLANNYYAEGLDTPEEIGKKYCPINEEHWVALVKELM